jgi:hypothetical protein
MRHAICCGFATMLLAAADVKAMTADELIAKNIQARGGEAKIKAIQSLQRNGTLSVGGGATTMETVERVKRNGGYRGEATLQGLTLIFAYDGKEGWQVQPFGGRKDPDKLSGDDAKALADAADIDGPLVDYKAKGYQVELLGSEDVDGTQAYKLRVSRKGGDVDYVFIDPDQFLEIREVNQRRVRGVLQESESDFGEYAEVNGVFLPFAVETGDVGSADKGQKRSYTKIEANVAVDDSIFHFPAVAGGSK